MKSSNGNASVCDINVWYFDYSIDMITSLLFHISWAIFHGITICWVRCFFFFVFDNVKYTRIKQSFEKWFNMTFQDLSRKEVSENWTHNYNINFSYYYYVEWILTSISFIYFILSVLFTILHFKEFRFLQFYWTRLSFYVLFHWQKRKIQIKFIISALLRYFSTQIRIYLLLFYRKCYFQS